MSGHTFQFSPDRGVEQVAPSDDDFEIVPANPDMFRRPDLAALAPTLSKAVVKRPERIALQPLNVVKAAKARRRELKREIARLRKLEGELAELERLIAAAEMKPRAVVREISAAKRG